MKQSGFLPPRLAGIDARQKTIFDGAVEIAKSRHHLKSNVGAAASWYFQRRGLHIALGSRVSHGDGTHTFDVRLRWRRRTVFQAVFHQRLYGGGRNRCEVQVYDDVPGEWEALLAAFRRA